MKIFIQNICLSTLLLYFSAFPGHAQAPQRVGPERKIDSLAHSLDSYTNGMARTSLYIRTSKDVYESMEDLWFKVYAVDAQHQQLSAIDQTLYVQLIHEQKDSIVWEELYPIDQGTANGHIYLDNALPDGNYWLCAYSAHSLSGAASAFLGVRRIKLVREVSELLRKKPVAPVADHPPKKIQFSLLPEGGVLLSGVTNQIAFKAVAEDGLPCPVAGTLFNGDTAIAHFKSAHAGMGSFLLRPEPGRTYTVRLDAPFADHSYPLPVIRETGMNFRLLRHDKDSVVFRIYHQGAAKQLCYFRLQTRGLTQLMAAAEVKDSLDLGLPLQEVASGIAEATLFDHRAIPIAERLLYIKPDKRLFLTTKVSRENDGRKAKISLHIHAADAAGKPAVAQLGAVVYDKIYHQPTDPKDIQTHYLLSAQLKGNIYDPGYYFDTTKTNRLAALDLLLLTQGWRAYSWNEEALKKSGQQVLADSIKGSLIALRKKAKLNQQAVMLFDAAEQHNQLATVDKQGIFWLTAEQLKLSQHIYIKHFGDQYDLEIKVDDPFMAIRQLKPWQNIGYPIAGAVAVQPDTTNPFILTRGSIRLKEVSITGKTEVVFRDKYIGRLDSLQKYQNLTDRAHGGWLNCPAGDGDERPIEGHTYIVWTGPNPPTTHPFTFDATNTKHIVYHYPQYTEAELLKRFGLGRSRGYYPKKEFYAPDYDKEQDALPDYRNMLLWTPDIVTDENGDAKLEFFSSDINGVFYGLVEGIGGDGTVGKGEFEVRVRR